MTKDSSSFSKTPQDLVPRNAASSLGLVYFEPLQQASQQTNEPDSNGVLEYLQLIRGHKILVLSMLVVGTLAGCALSVMQTPVYEARTFLEFDSPARGDAAAGIAGRDAAGFAPESFLQTQIKVLQSKTLNKRVKQRMRAEAPGGTRLDAGKLARLRNIIGLKTPRAKDLSPELLQARVVDNSGIVEILCQAADPQFAAAYANTMASEYIEYSLESLWDSSHRTSDWMNKQLAHLKKNLEESENQLQSYGQSSGLVYTGAQETIDTDTLKQLQQQLSTAKAERIAKQSLAEVAGSTQVDSIPQVGDEGRLSEYQRKIAELRQEQAELLSLYTPSHYKVLKNQAQIAALEKTLANERKSIRDRIDNDYQGALRRERLLAVEYGSQMQRLRQTDRKSVFYDVLKHEVDTDRAIYDQVLQKSKQVELGSGVQAGNVRVLDVAEIPARPVKPNLAQNASLGLLFGLVGAFGLVIGREFIDRSVRAPGEAPFHLQVPELGVIPSQKYFLQQVDRRTDHHNGNGNGNGNGHYADRPFGLETWQDHPSLLAESFRGALASLMVAGDGATMPRVIMVTSAGKGEGKSSIVSNLGIALAEINQRVLLLDADMRKPHLHDIFNISNSWGLSDLLREKSPLDNYPVEALARKTDIDGLYLLPSGPGTVSIANLLYSRRLFELLQRLRKEFDVVVIDTPPMLYITDARVLGRLADGAILVLRASKTTRDAARAAKQRLVDDGIPVLGTILNEWDLRAKPRYGYYTSYAY